MNLTAALRGIALAVGVLALPELAEAAEIKVVSSNAAQAMLKVAAPVFEKQTGHKVILGFGTSQQVAKRVSEGESADLAIITPEAIDQLVAQGKLQAGSRIDVARSLVGVAVKKGAPKPDISTPEALKKTLLAAKTVTFSAPSTGATSGVHTEKMFERLGIAAEMKPRYVLGDGNSTALIVIRGEAEMAIQQISALKPYDVDVVGPLPDELQYVTILSAGISSAPQSPETVQAFIKFLGSPEGVAAIRSVGLEPR
jgi:molybdate transport system substrate-binding protein